MNVTVEKLRQSGNRVRVSHYRWYETSLGDELLAKYEIAQNNIEVVDGPFPYGGMTKIEITTPDGESLTGVAECSDRDNFSRKRGVAIALGRAITNKEVA